MSFSPPLAGHIMKMVPVAMWVEMGGGCQQRWAYMDAASDSQDCCGQCLRLHILFSNPLAFACALQLELIAGQKLIELDSVSE